MPTQHALRLTKPLYECQQNVTGDSRFTSVEIEDHLLQKGLKLFGFLGEKTLV